MMIGHFVKTLRREQRLLFGEVLGNGSGAGGILSGRDIMEAPEKTSMSLLNRARAKPLGSSCLSAGEGTMIWSCLHHDLVMPPKALARHSE
jgi:hypothetical protein